MKAFTPIVVAALFAAANAATVKLETTKCGDIKTESFDVTLDTVVAKELKSVCGLQIVSAEGAYDATIECEAFKDAAGKESGSAKFKKGTPALISTNPVQINSVQCKVFGFAGASGTGAAGPSSTGAAGAPGSTGTPGSTGAPGQGGAGGSGTNGTNPAPGSPTPAANPNGAEKLGLSLGAVAAVVGLGMAAL
ncbi:unnamed protein product [Periconia digitata]|uniref:Uncharacterized protein n=1 Tax=Periconia digitata TaxID=1303443 RepID=A0A9W4U7A9_9PLEO|nr:unnamed protein product [Periconia digitata]